MRLANVKFYCLYLHYTQWPNILELRLYVAFLKQLQPDELKSALKYMT